MSHNTRSRVVSCFVAACMVAVALGGDPALASPLPPIGAESPRSLWGDLAGRFAGSGLSLTLEDAGGGRMRGVLVFHGRPCAVAGFVEDGELDGVVVVDGEARSFAAEWVGEALHIEVDDDFWILQRVTGTGHPAPAGAGGQGHVQTWQGGRGLTSEQAPPQGTAPPAGQDLLRSPIGSGGWGQPSAGQVGPTVATHPSGFSVRLAPGWSARDDGPSLTLLPPAPLQGTAGLECTASVQTFDAPRSVTDPDVLSQLVAQMGAAMGPSLRAEAPPDVLQGFPEGAVLLRYVGVAPDGTPMRVHVRFRALDGRLLRIGAVGPDAAVRHLDASLDAMFRGMAPMSRMPEGWGTPNRPSPADSSQGWALPSQGHGIAQFAELRLPGSGFTLRYPATWMANGQGTAAILSPDPAAAQRGQMVSVISMPWDVRLPLQTQDFINLLSGFLAQGQPGVQPAGQPEALAHGGVLLPVTVPSPMGTPLGLRVFARAGGQALVLLMSMGDQAAMAQQEPVVRAIYDSIQFTGEVPITMATPPAQPTPNQAPPATSGADPQIVGVWSRDVVLSSPSSPAYPGAGGATHVTQIVLILSPDGTFQQGSRAAGGDANTSFTAGFQVSATGRWAVTEANGGRYIVTMDHQGQQGMMRYALHNGQLVLGEPGQRQFYDRLR